MPEPNFINDYTYVRDLGEGGFGKVFLCKKKKMQNKLVAIKVIMLDGEIDEKYAEREFDMAKLNHGNIVALLKGWKEEATAQCPFGIKLPSKQKFLIEMEYCNGGSLRDALVTYRRKMKNVALILKDVARGLAFIHEKGIMHRDLKPENVLLVVDEGYIWNTLKCAKIGDLGLARNLVASINATGSRTKSMTNAGTPCYWSPEQATEKKYDSKTDIYPIGIIFMELITAYAWSKYLTPATGNSYFEININSVTVLAKYYPAEVKMIKEMMSANPEDRPTAKEIGDWLKRYDSL